MKRRTLLKLLAGAPLMTQVPFAACVTAATRAKTTLRVTTFDVDITPPLGSPLCGGWIRSATAVDDPLRARGMVLLGAERPIVLCALDWVETNNATYDAWRAALAAAAGTDEHHVAVQCTHPHNTPWANIKADADLHEIDEALHIVDAPFVREAIKRTAAALQASLAAPTEVTHVGCGQGRVEKVASNRRILGPDGKVAAMRMSKCSDARLREAPEGQIDPFLKTVSLWNNEQPVVALHYYATHPMSYYGDGRVTSDFCGLARAMRQREQPDVMQIYFTGCAGDIAAGKYNDGKPETRIVLRDRIHAGMVAAWEATERRPLGEVEWGTVAVKLPVREEPEFSPEHLRQVMQDKKARLSRRAVAAITLSWIERADKPIEISRLRIGDVQVVHLPGEPFIDFQLFAQQQRPSDFVCVAGYGDGGPGYIPLNESYAQGGYEPTMAFVAEQSDPLLRQAIAELLAAQA